MADIYENLENFKEILTYGELALENEDLKTKLDDTTAELKQIKMDILQAFDKLAADHQQLLVNYSALLKTARAEVERKADLMINANSKNDYMFLRMLFEKANFGKRRGKRLSKMDDFKSSRPKKKSGSADTCEQSLKARNLKGDKDQQLERKDLQPKSKTDYRIPKLTKPKDEPVVPKKETKSELQKERKYNDDFHEKENKETVKAGSIFNRRKSMPVVRHEPATFSSDEETESTSTLTARSYSTKDDTKAASDKYRQGKSIELSRKKSCEPQSSDLRHSGHKEALDSSHTDQGESTNIEHRHADQRYSDHREPHKDRDLRHKIAKNLSNRDLKRSPRRCPSREDRYRHKDFREREGPHSYKDRHRRFEAPAHHLDNRLSRRDVHDRRQNERGRLRVLESPETNKYVRHKSHDRRSHYHQPVRAHIEHKSLKSKQDNQTATQKIQDSTGADLHPGGQQRDELSKHNCDYPKDQPVKSKIRDEDEGPAKKRRRVESRSVKEDSGRNEEVEPIELATLQPQTCRSPDELIMENVNVETPVKEIATTVAIGLGDPRLTSTRYMKIVEEKNRIRLSTVTGRNVDLVVLPPYSNDIFQSQDPNNKFEEYTEEDLVKDIYIDYDDKDDHSMESGEIDESCIYSDLISDPQPTHDVQEKQQTSNIIPALLAKPPDTPQMSELELLQSTPVKSRLTKDTEVLQESITSTEGEHSEKANEDEPSYSEAMTKKFRIPKKKSTENTRENSETKSLETPNVTNAPKTALESILSHITQKSLVQTTEDSLEANSSSKSIETIDCATEKSKTDLAACPSSMHEAVSNSARSSFGIEDGQLTEVDAKTLKRLNVTSPTKNPLQFILRHIPRESGLQTTAENIEAKNSSVPIEIENPVTEKSGTDLATFSENSVVVNKGEAKEKVLTKRQIVAGDLELSDDENSTNTDFHRITAKEVFATAKEETKQVETKKQKARSIARQERTDKKKMSGKVVDKVKPMSNKFTELFGDSSSLITPEDLEVYTHPNVKLQSVIDPTIDEEAAVHIDVSEMAMTGSHGKPTESKKMRTRSSNKTKSDNAVTKKTAKHVSEVTQKGKVDKETAILDEEMEELPSEVVPKAVRINSAVEAEAKFVKTVIISTGTQPVLSELTKVSNTPVITTSPVGRTLIISAGTQPVIDEALKADNATFKPFSRVNQEPIAIATSTPFRDSTNDPSQTTSVPDRRTSGATRTSDDDSSRQSVTVDSLSQSKEVDAPDVRVILKRRRKRVIK